MKTTLTRSTLKHSIFSLLVLGIFVLLATGSYDIYEALDIDVTKKVTPDGKVGELEQHNSTGYAKLTEGYQDKQGRWHGWINVYYGDTKDDEDQIQYEERVFMMHGRRNGILTRTYRFGGKVEEEHYLNGVKISNKKSAGSALALGSAFEVLQARHPWFLAQLDYLEFDALYVENFLDSLEGMLTKASFEMEDFDDYYDMALDTLRDTPNDSLLVATDALTGSLGVKRMKDDELRQAVVDRYREGGNSTYNVLSSSYPNYAQEMSEFGISSGDLEAFCIALDDSLGMLPTPNPLDTFFVDSAEYNFYIALFSFTLTDDLKGARKSGPINHGEAIDMRRHLEKSFKGLTHKGTSETPEEVGAIAVTVLLGHLVEGDILRAIVRDATMSRKGIPDLPVAGTGLVSVNSPTSATLQGNVIEDGGAAVIARGIAWATHYNPTVDDNLEESGTGTGAFEVDLEGLNEGQTYYARTYATNSSGTAYGNVVSFDAENTVGTIGEERKMENLRIYPNPASSVTTFSFDSKSGKIGKIFITDLSGRTVWQEKLPAGTNGIQEIRLDLTDLPEGLYHCAVKIDSQAMAKGQLVIAR